MKEAIPETMQEASFNNFDDLLFDNAQQINDDQDYWFKLRGDSINNMIDAATSLFGLSIRIRQMHQCDNVDEIYKLTVEEIKAIEVELTEANYDHAIILAYRYILCAFIDEAVMSTSWGADSIWGQHSLLTRFHNESWGGEKVFSILARLENEPAKYQNLLEFIYLCLCLGFEGRYRVIERGKELHARVITNLHQTLASLEPSIAPVLTSGAERVVVTQYTLGKQWPIWSVFAIFLLFSTATFLLYSFLLSSKSTPVLEQLQQVLSV